MTRSPQSTSSEIMNVSVGPLASTAKRKRSTQQAQPEASTRELRSQSKNHDSNSLSARVWSSKSFDSHFLLMNVVELTEANRRAQQRWSSF